MQIVRAEDDIYAGGALEQGLSGILGHASADRDEAARPAFFQFSPVPEVTINLVLGSFANRASIENHQIRGFDFASLLVADLFQKTEHMLGIRLVHLTAEGFYIN